ncbi:hypothetical protein Tco_0045027 [Tanacetum coccineum]
MLLEDPATSDTNDTLAIPKQMIGGCDVHTNQGLRSIIERQLWTKVLINKPGRLKLKFDLITPVLSKELRSELEDFDVDEVSGSVKDLDKCNANGGLDKKKKKRYIVNGCKSKKLLKFHHLTYTKNDGEDEQKQFTLQINLLQNSVRIHSDTAIRKDGRVQSYCGLRLTKTTTRFLGVRIVPLQPPDGNRIDIDQIVGPSTSKYASNLLRKRSAGTY